MTIANPLKVFSINDSNWSTVWDQIKKDCVTLSNWGIWVFSEKLKLSVKTVILESHYTCKDHRNLFSNFYSKKFAESTPYSNRLHFFSENNIDISEVILNPENLKDSYMGFSVIRPVAERCIGRTVIDPFKINGINKNNFFCLRTTFNVHINGSAFDVAGYPFMSQDSDVTVCAHSALWGVCRYLSERYNLYGEIYPFDLIKYTESNTGRAFPYRGMTYADYCKILSTFGVYPIILRLKENRTSTAIDQEEFKNLYTYVESGFPVLASFQGHVITLIGHTIDYEKNPTANTDGFIDSSCFLKQFIVVDDNTFPYQTLGAQTDPDNYGVLYNNPKNGIIGGYNIDSIVTAVCPLPEKVFLPAEKARIKGLKYFSDTDIKSKLQSSGAGPWVIRLFLSTNASFKRRKLYQVKSTNDQLCFFVTTLKLPHFIWIMEVSTIEQYKSGKCLAELILDPTSSELEYSVLYMRIGNSITINKQEVKHDGQPDFFYQFTHNLGEKVI